LGIGIGLVIGIAALLFSLAYGGALRRVLRLGLRPDLGHRLAEPSELPADVLALLERHGRELESLGFERFEMLCEADAVDFVDDPVWTAVCRSDSELGFAFLSMSQSPTRSHPCTVIFRSFSDTGQVIETVQSGTPRDRAGHVVIDAQTRSLRAQWERHRSEVAARSDFSARDLGRDELVVECADGYKKSIAADVADGTLVRRADGRLRVPLRAALARVVRANFGAKRKPAPEVADPVPAPPVEEREAETPDVTAEVWAHRRREALGRSRPAGWVRKLAVFVASVCAFALAFGMRLSPANVATLFGVLLIHELGHALAMKGFGYRDLQILFIPFLGAVASGDKRDAKPHQEILVLLAGPVPGIALGALVLGLGLGERTPWLRDAATLMLIVNYMNLLPVMPLDGGRIMNIVLFDRFPRLRLGFSAASALAIAYAGAVWGDTVLRVFGLFVLLGLPRQLAQSRLLAAVRARLARLEPEPAAADPLPAIYTELRSPKFDAWNAETRYQNVVELARQLVRRPAGAGLAVASIVVWVAVMVLPVGFVQYRKVARIDAALADEQAVQERMAADWDAKLAAARTPADRARVHLAAAEALVGVSRGDAAERHLEAAKSLLDPAADRALEATRQLLLGRIDADRFGDSSDPRERASAIAHLERALDRREQVFGPESLEVAEVLEAFPAETSSERAAALVRQLRLASIYARAFAGDGSHARRLVEALQSESLLRIEGKEPERAEAALLRAAEVADASTGSDRTALRSLALSALGDFYFESQRYADVRAVLARRETLGPTPSVQLFGVDLELEIDRCWLAVWEGDPEVARACFAKLHARVSKSAAASSRGLHATFPFALDEIAASARTGDDAGARRLLAEMREALERDRAGSFDESARLLLGDASAGGSAWSPNESRRRLEERKRWVEPLLAAAEARETR
jgi:Zn-dependent protease